MSAESEMQRFHTQQAIDTLRTMTDTVKEMSENLVDPEAPYGGPASVLTNKTVKTKFAKDAKTFAASAVKMADALQDALDKWVKEEEKDGTS